MSKRKKILKLTLMLAGFVGTVVFGIAAFKYSADNPDMTNMRKILSNPGPYVTATISLIVAIIGREI